MTNRRRLRFYLPLPVLAVAALVWPLAKPDAPPRSAGEVAYASLPDQPAGEVEPGRAGVEPSAIALAHWLHALPSAPGSDVPCAEDHLHVSWTAPATLPPHGAYVGPLGPEPTATTDAVNGIVLCTGSETDTLMGFRARYVDDRWDVVATPDAGDEGDLPEVTTPEPEAPNTTPVPSAALDGRTFTASVEGLAAYEPQRTCDGTAKPGTTALRNLLLRDNAGSRSLGIVRGCSIGGTSEHKEGRAFDWGVNVGNARERAEADAFVGKLLATDQFGNRYALARRMGVMYVIWNRQIWSAYRADEGWRPYHGASAHTDHVHVSLSWAGAQARTSFWSGNVVQVLLASAPKGVSSSAGSAGKARRVTSVSTQLAAADRARRDAARKAAWEKRRADAEAWKAAHAEEQAAARATWEADKAARDAKRAEDRAAWEAKHEADQAARQAARQEAAEKYAADKAARDAAKQAATEQAAAAKAARDQAYAERRAADQAARDAAKQASAEKAAADRAARDAAAQAAADRYAADKAARDAARQAAAEKAAAERKAREEARRHRSTTTTTAPRATTTTAPATTTTAPPTSPTTEG